MLKFTFVSPPLLFLLLNYLFLSNRQSLREHLSGVKSENYDGVKVIDSEMKQRKVKGKSIYMHLVKNNFL